MILESFFTFLPALLAGFGLAHLLWKSSGNAWSLGLKFFLGVGLGLGITSCLYFFRLVIFPGQGGYLSIELGFLAAVLIAVILKRRISLDVPFQPPSISWMSILFALGTLFALYSAMSYSLAKVRNSPHGDYDAQAIWNLRARSIYRLGDAWENAFSPEINRNFHMDYPLLVPLNVVGGWNTLGEEVLRIPAILSMLFLYAAAGILFCLLAYLRSISQASLAAMILLTTPLLLLMTSFQSADIAIAYYFLSVTALLILFLIEDNAQFLFLAGMMAALAAWAKNEGIPFLVITILFTSWILGRQNGLKKIRGFLAGSFLPVATILLFKIHVPVSRGNDLFAGNGLMTILSKIADPSRYVSIITRLVSEIIHVGEWQFSIVVIMAVYGLFVGSKRSLEYRAISRSVALLPLAQLAVYFGIYLVTPHDLVWHMNYSMSRLLLHLFPAALLLFFISINTPEDVFELVPKNNKGVQ
jgi:hypothetical protein